jgi:poly(ADP-ribose) glycohydrolase
LESVVDSCSNWGCGAFGGYHDLKAVIQLLAAAEAERDVTYFTFGVKGLAPSLQELHSLLRVKKITVGRKR